MFQEPRVKYSDNLVNVWIEKPWVSNGSRIPCRIERFSGETDKKSPEKTLVIYSHGNAENLLHCAQTIRELSKALKVDVISYDYSGYGLNRADTFERSEEGVNLTLQTIYNAMVDPSSSYNYKPENVVLLGYSLGSGPSVYLASTLGKTKGSLRGLVLFGAYSSILDVVEDSTHKKVTNLFSNRWNSVEHIVAVNCPILILHGQSDGLINVKHAQRLKHANRRAKLVIMPNIGHTSYSWFESIKEVKTWLQTKC
jgi:pimeloyl-ACP methyl ester carboxylesterase